MNTFYDFSANGLNGETTPMEVYSGKWVLVVNTASRCGFTPQYAGLELLYKKYHDKGLVILGFPCNQFGGQEPGGAQEIAQTCHINYGVSFPMFSKVDVNGENAHPLFKWLTQSLPGFLGRRIKWNFTKFLIDRDGKPIKRFSTLATPEQIEKYLRTIL